MGDQHAAHIADQVATRPLCKSPNLGDQIGDEDPIIPSASVDRTEGSDETGQFDREEQDAENNIRPRRTSRSWLGNGPDLFGSASGQMD